MARQGSGGWSLSVNTELHSWGSNPDTNVHMLSPEKHSCPPTSCQSSATFMLQHAEIKNVPCRVTSARLLFLTLQGKSSVLAVMAKYYIYVFIFYILYIYIYYILAKWWHKSQPPHWTTIFSKLHLTDCFRQTCKSRSDANSSSSAVFGASLHL